MTSSRTFSTLTAGALVALSLVFSGCGELKREPAISYMPDMHVQDHLKAYEADPISGERSMREPVAGTVAQGHVDYNLPFDLEGTEADKIQNPLPQNLEILEAGRRNFNIYCVVCHGERGAGNGPIIPDLESFVPAKGENPAQLKLHGGRQTLFPMKQMMVPPVLTTDKINQWSDGRIFNLITHGRGNMPPYAQVSPSMRWAIVRYLRVLYKAEHPSESEYQDYKSHAADYLDISPAKLVQWKNQ